MLYQKCSNGPISPPFTTCLFTTYQNLCMEVFIGSPRGLAIVNLTEIKSFPPINNFDHITVCKLVEVDLAYYCSVKVVVDKTISTICVYT